MKKVIVSLLLALSIAIPSGIMLAVQKNAKKAPKTGTVKTGKLNDYKYTEILAQMIRLQKRNRRKYKVVNPAPQQNTTVKGRSSANKFAAAMKRGRKKIFKKYGIRARDFERYSNRLDKAASTPKGLKRQQKIYTRAAKKAR